MYTQQFLWKYEMKSQHLLQQVIILKQVAMKLALAITLDLYVYVLVMLRKMMSIS